MPAKTPKSDAKKRPPGRPWQADGRRTVLAVRFNEDEHALLLTASHRSDTPLATLIREAAVASAKRIVNRRG